MIQLWEFRIELDAFLPYHFCSYVSSDLAITFAELFDISSLHWVLLRVLQLLIVVPHKRPANTVANESLSNVMLEIIMRVESM